MSLTISSPIASCSMITCTDPEAYVCQYIWRSPSPRPITLVGMLPLVDEGTAALAGWVMFSSLGDSCNCFQSSPTCSCRCCLATSAEGSDAGNAALFRKDAARINRYKCTAAAYIEVCFISHHCTSAYQLHCTNHFFSILIHGIHDFVPYPCRDEGLF